MSTRTIKIKINKGRIKKVFNNLNECIERFVTRSIPFGVYRYRGGGSWMSKTRKGEIVDAVYFKGSRIFSYGSHYLLGRIDLDINGVLVSIVNFKKYSKSTTIHSWAVRHELQKSKRLIIETNELEEFRLNSSTTDNELRKIVKSIIRRECFEINEDIFESQFRPLLDYRNRNINRRIKNHNKIAKALRLNKLIVKFPSVILKASKIVSALAQDAFNCSRTRRQMSLLGYTQSLYSKRRYV